MTLSDEQILIASAAAFNIDQKIPVEEYPS